METQLNASVYTDFSGLADLKRLARSDPDVALRQVAQQFEGIFMQMVLKSMREASLGDAMFDSQQGDFYREMFDSQIALTMSEGKGIGLADVLMRQLRSQVLPAETNAENANNTNVGQVSLFAMTVRVAPRTNLVTHDVQFESQEEFVAELWPLAEEAAEELGVPPQAIIAQAALETGWGKKVIQHRDGNSSYNLFNIKADARWEGDRVTIPTLEYSQGVAQKQNAQFRSYDSFEDSFQDYVDFLQTNPRYFDARMNSFDSREFIQKIHHAGYATDPRYVEKVIGIMERDVVKFHETDPVDIEAEDLVVG